MKDKRMIEESRNQSKVTDEELFRMLYYQLVKGIASYCFYPDDVFLYQIGRDGFLEDMKNDILYSEFEIECSSPIGTTQILYVPIFIDQPFRPFRGWLRLEWNIHESSIMTCEILDEIQKLHIQGVETTCKGRTFHLRQFRPKCNIYEYLNDFKNPESDIYIKEIAILKEREAQPIEYNVVSNSVTIPVPIPVKAEECSLEELCNAISPKEESK